MTITPRFDQPPPCMGKHTLFDSRLRADHLKAKQLCDTCSVFAACWDNLQTVLRADKAVGGSPEGTWAGRLFAETRMAGSEVSDHGADAAYRRHRYIDEDPCEDCKKAHAEANRKKAQELAALRARKRAETDAA